MYILYCGGCHSINTDSGSRVLCEWWCDGGRVRVCGVYVGEGVGFILCLLSLGNLGYTLFLGSI